MTLVLLRAVVADVEFSSSGRLEVAGSVSSQVDRSADT